MILSREYKELPVEKLNLQKRNARHGDVGAISEAIDEVGFTAPIIVQKGSMLVIAGNHRLKAARAIGLTTVPCMIVDVDAPTAARIAIGDNRIAQRATWDEAELIEQLRALGDADLLSGTGYDLDDLDALIERGGSPPLGEAAPQGRGPSSSHPDADEPSGGSPALARCLVKRLAIYSRKGVSWVATAAWRSVSYRDGIQALKAAKDDCALETVQSCAEDLEAAAVAVDEALDSGAIVTTTPARDAAFKGGAHFATEAAKLVAGRLGLKFDGSCFAARAADRKGHHPRREKEPPVVLRAPPAVLLLDDMTTSGETIELCVKALRAQGSRVSTLVWISGRIEGDEP